MSKLSNALAMLDILSVKSIQTREELARALEISPRAVQRLKDDLELAGYDIVSQFGLGGGYSLLNKSQIKPRAFTSEEIRVLKQALSFLMNQDLGAFDSSTLKTLASLSTQLDDYGLQNIEHFQSIKLNVDPDTYHKHIRLLEEAIVSHSRVKIQYQKNHRERRAYVFEPYNLVIVNKFWYLLGNEYPSGRHLSLKINRMDTIDYEGSMFRFDVETSKKSVLSDFGYKIKPTYMECIIQNRDYLSEYIWGENQEIEWIDDHTFKMSVIFPNENAAKDFILQNGSGLTLIGPRELLDWHKKEIETIASRYACN